MANILVEILKATLVPNAQILKQATLKLEESSAQQGFCAALMEITSDTNMPSDIRQAALVQLKNNVNSRWKPLELTKQPKDKIVYISENEKQQIKSHLLKAMIRGGYDPKYLKLFKNIVQIVIGYSFKEGVNLQEIIECLPTANLNIALHYLLGILAAFEVSVGQQRKMFDKLIENIFPPLFELAAICGPTATNFVPNETYYLVTKCLWKSIHMDMCKYFKEQSEGWMTFLLTILKYNNETLNSQVNYKNKNSTEGYYFRTKKMVSKILLKYFQKHANGKYSSSFQAYANEWLGRYSDAFLVAMYEQLKINNLPKTKFFLLKSYVSLAYYRPKRIQPFIQGLMMQITPHYMRMKPEDEDLARNEPLEFLRNDDDYGSSLSNVKAAAADFWVSLCDIPADVKTDEVYLPKYTLGIIQIVVSFLQNSANPVEKEMGMYIFSKIKTSLYKHPQAQKLAPSIIETYIIKQLSSPTLLLRARALDIFIMYGNIEIKSEPHLIAMVEGIIMGLAAEQNAIIRVKSACALNCILKHKRVVELVNPHLSNILQIYILMLDKYELQQLVQSFTGIVSYFDISQYAVEVTKHLSSLFEKYYKIDLERIDDDNYEGEVENAAGGIIITIAQIIKGNVSQEALNSIEEYVCKIIAYSFTLNGADYLEDTMKLLNSFIFKTDAISGRMWFFFPTLIYSIIGHEASKIPQNIPENLVPYQTQIFQLLPRGYNVQHFDSILPVLLNYIYKGIAAIVKEKDYFGTPLFELLLRMIEKTYGQYQKRSTSDFLCCTYILMYILENFKFSQSAPSQFIWQIIKFNMNYNKSKHLKMLNIQLLSMFIFNCPQEAILNISKDNCWQVLSNHMLNYEKQCHEHHEKQRLMLGLSVLMAIKSKPGPLVELLPGLFKLLVTLAIQVGYERFSDKEYDRSEDDNIDELQEHSDEQDNQDYFWSVDREDCYVSRLPFYDEILIFRQTLNCVRKDEQQKLIFQPLVSQIKPKQKKELEDVFKKHTEYMTEKKQKKTM